MIANFTALYSEYRHLIVQNIYRMVGNYHTSEDLAQEVFLRAFTHLDTLDSHKNIRAWLFRVAKNVVVDYYRSRRHKNDTALDIFIEYYDVVVDDIADSVAEAVDVRQALTKLSPVECTVLLAHDVEELPFHQISSKRLSGGSQTKAHYQYKNARKHFKEVYQ